MTEGWFGAVHGFVDFIIALGSAGPERKSGPSGMGVLVLQVYQL